MASPITGPFSSEYRRFTDGVCGRYEQITRYRQKRPYNQPLPFRHTVTEVTRWSTTTPWYQAADGGTDRARPKSTSEVGDLLNSTLLKAKTRFDAKIGDQASVLISLAERQQSMSMMTTRLLQMGKFVSALKRGSVHGAAVALGIMKNPKLLKIYLARLRAKVFLTRLNWRVSKKRGLTSKQSKFDAHKAFANNYLEFHFGWAPLAGDIHSAAQILSSEVNDDIVKGSATLKKEEVLVSGYASDWRTTWKNSFRVGISATVKIANRNLFLAARLGLFNLAAVPFELISYSFVLDWFVNVSEFLGQFTEFAGVSLVDLQYSYRNTASVDWIITGAFGAPDNFGSSKMDEFTRYVGPLPFINLAVRHPWRLSPRRGLAAISLLIQKMS